ncbi:MAG: hypothetical protein AAB438_00525 [Patescibacteria group bacterium]
MENTQKETLETDVSSQNIFNFIKKNYPKWTIFIIIINLFFLYIIISSKFIPFLIFFFIIDMIFLGIFSAVKRKAFLKQFAKTNGYTYEARADVRLVPSLYLQMGHSREMTNIISGTYKNSPIKLFEFKCVIGYGKHRRTIQFTTFEITYKTELKSIFLRSKKNKWAITNLFEGMGDDIRFGKVLKLEGNFNDFFTLYVPEDYEMEALQIFTPEVMAKLMDTANGFSFEFTGNKLFIYSPNIIHKKEALNNIFTFAKTLIEDLAPRLERIK